MDRLLKLAPLLLATFASPALAQSNAESWFVGFSVAICMKTVADPVAIRRIAQSKQWEPVAVASGSPDQPQFLVGGKSFGPSDIWAFEHDGTSFEVTLIAVPGQPKLRYCSLTAYNLDADAVDAGFLNGNKSGRAPKLGNVPVKNYRFAEYPGTISYMLGGTPDRIAHTVSFVPAHPVSDYHGADPLPES